MTGAAKAAAILPALHRSLDLAVVLAPKEQITQTIDDHYSEKFDKDRHSLSFLQGRPASLEESGCVGEPGRSLFFS
jgi:hypothetical protein